MNIFFFFSSPLSCLSETFQKFISLRLFDSRISFSDALFLHLHKPMKNIFRFYFASIHIFIPSKRTFSLSLWLFLYFRHCIISAANSSTFRLHVQLGCVMFCREKSFFGTFRSILFGFWRFSLLTTFPNIFLNNPFLKFSAKYFHVGAAFISSNIQDVWIFFVQTFFLSSFFIKNTRPVQEMCLHHSRDILWMNSGQKKHRRMQSCRLGERLLRETSDASTHADGKKIALK